MRIKTTINFLKKLTIMLIIILIINVIYNNYIKTKNYNICINMDHTIILQANKLLSKNSINIEEKSIVDREKIIQNFVKDVDTGKAGNGNDRKKYLGEYYDEVQKIISNKYKTKKKTKYINHTPQNTTLYYYNKNELQNYAYKLVIFKGWSEKDFNCLILLWERESGWNPNSHNKNTGAHGIPQSLPASKMSSYGEDYYTNGYTQIRWGLDYISNRYGTPSNAWNHFQRNGWY